MRRAVYGALAGAVLGLAWAPGAGAVEISLWDWAFYVNGTTYPLGEPLPSNIDATGFDFSTGLGTVKVKYDPIWGAAFNVVGFFDHELDETANGFINEDGTANHSPSTGETWEIDEPGYLYGDIYGHVFAGANALDHTVGPWQTVDRTRWGDVSMAIGRAGPLQQDAQWRETADVLFLLSDTAPTSGFFLQQVDLGSGSSIYFSSSVDITRTQVPGGGGGGGVQPIPEPGTLALVGSGLTAVLGWKGRRRA